MLYSKSGFSLIELSIVIVVISLLIGGVISGASLIEKTKLQSVIQEFNDIQLAVNNFRLKFNAMPGDMKDADSLLGSGADCNGDGDGLISIDVSAPKFENMCAWLHLRMSGSLTGYLNADYTGEFNDHNNSVDPGVDVPVSRLGDAVYILYGARRVDINGNFLFLVSSDTNSRTTNPALTSKQTNSITQLIASPFTKGNREVMAVQHIDLVDSSEIANDCFNQTTRTFLNITDNTTKRCALMKIINSY